MIGSRDHTLGTMPTLGSRRCPARAKAAAAVLAHLEYPLEAYMRFRNLVLPFLATTLVLGCDDSTLAPVDAPESRAAQGDRSEWELVDEYSVPEDEAFALGFVSCINGGIGENVIAFGGPYRMYVKTVITPSGSIHNRGRIVAEQETWIGEDTGDVWLTSLDAKYNEFVRAVDGHYLAQEPIAQILTNADTDEQVRVKAMYRMEIDEDGNLVNNNPRVGEVFSCHVRK